MCILYIYSIYIYIYTYHIIYLYSNPESPSEEALPRSPCAALRKSRKEFRFCLRQTRYHKALTKIVKGGFQNNLKIYGYGLKPWCPDGIQI